MMLFRRLAAAAAIAALVPSAGAACSFGYGAWFWHHHAPGPALAEYLSGDLGILSPFRYPRVPGPLYEVVAYRHLADLGLTADEQAMLAAFAEPEWQPEDASLAAWETARGQLTPKREHGAVVPYRRVVREVSSNPGTVYYQDVPNCYGDAFDTALATLRDRQRVYDSRQLEEWLRGQDQVFLACSGDATLPAAARPSWSRLLAADRAYQRAATYFYLQRYDQALERFRRIAADDGSPWRPIGAYLVARTLFRRAAPGDWDEARHVLESILADESLDGAHGSADLLLGFFLARSEPDARRRELAARMAAPRVAPDSSQLLIDYGLLLPARSEGEDVEEITEWILAFRGGAGAAALAAQRFLERRSLPWLVVAAMTASADGPLVDEMLAAVDEVPTSAPAFPTLAFHAARLQAELGRYQPTRARLEALLGDEALSFSDRNRILAFSAHIAPDLESYLRHAPLRAALVGYDDGAARTIPIGREGDGLDHFRQQRLLFPDDILFAINAYFPPGTVLAAARSEALPPPLRLRMARVAWVRAFVLGDDELAAAAAEHLVELEQEPQRAGLRRYLAARPGADRDFGAALHMLRNTDLAPSFHQLLPTVNERRLWCPGTFWHPRRDGVPEPPVFLVTDLEELGRTGPDPREVESGQRLLGRIVLDRARAHPDDDRLPEALHLVVRATRKGCRSESQKEISRAAFRMLHARYPGSVWAKRTPYWFD